MKLATISLEHVKHCKGNISDMANSAAKESKVNKSPTEDVIRKTGIEMNFFCSALSHVCLGTFIPVHAVDTLPSSDSSASAVPLAHPGGECLRERYIAYKV